MIHNYFRNGIMSNLLQGTTFTFPSNLWWALLIAMPDEEDDGAAIAGSYEVTGGGYSRVQLNPSGANYANVVNGQSYNNMVVQFPPPAGDWGTVIGVALLDDVSSGHAYFSGALIPPVTVTTGQSGPAFNVGQLITVID